MGTICAAAVAAAPADRTQARRALDAARREVAACEQALSRFDGGSDLSRLNGAAGSWIAVDTRLVEALEAALRARTETHGRFDPTILPALSAAGYDRSFELLTERAAMPVDGWHAGGRIDVDPSSRRARVERGAAVDLGGVGKGFAATRALHAMRRAWPGLTGALVDLGGDIAVWGTPPEGGPWRVDIADPRAPGRSAGTLELEGGGVATSGRDTRRFGPGGRLHHLIDPATVSRPSRDRSRSRSWLRAQRRPRHTRRRSLSPTWTRPAISSPRALTSERCSSPTPARRSSSAAFPWSESDRDHGYSRPRQDG